MYRLLYISTARAPISALELSAILNVSRRNNDRAGVTGLLVSGGRRFLQALEGDEAAVRTTVERIRLDPRHAGIVLLSQGQVATRAFPRWSMGHQPGGAVIGDTSMAATIAALIKPIADPSLRAYFTGFAELHAAA